MNVGDKVRVVKVPDGVPPDNVQLKTLFRGCIGKTFPIIKLDDGLVELHVGEAFGKAPEHHQIWLDPSCVKLAEA